MEMMKFATIFMKISWKKFAHLTKIAVCCEMGLIFDLCLATTAKYCSGISAVGNCHSSLRAFGWRSSID